MAFRLPAVQVAIVGGERRCAEDDARACEGTDTRCRASHCSRVVVVVVPEESWYKKVGAQGARPVLRSDVIDQQFATTTFTESIVGEGFILVG